MILDNDAATRRGPASDQNMPIVEQHEPDQLRRRIEMLEDTVRQLPPLKTAIEDTNIRLHALVERSEDMSLSVRQLGQTHSHALDTFRESLAKQRDEYRDMLIAQEERWRKSLERIEAQYNLSIERIVEETMSRISGMFVKSTAETVARWAWPGILAAGIAGAGWLYHLLFQS